MTNFIYPLRRFLLTLIIIIFVGGLFSVPLLLNAFTGEALPLYNTRMIRLFALGLGIMALTRCLVPFSVFSRCLLSALFIPVAWVVAYLYVFIFMHNHNEFIGYYTSSLILFYLLLATNILLTLLKPSRTITFIKWLYWGFLAMLLLPPCIYVGFYRIYSVIFDTFALLAIFETNPAEISGYLLTVFQPRTLLLFSLLLVFFLFMLKQISFWGTKPHYATKTKCHVALCLFIITLFPLSTYRKLFFPINHYQHLVITREWRDLKEHLDKNTATLVFQESPFSQGKGTYLIIIGESASRDWMSAYNPKLQENNTPWEKRMRRDSSFMFFDNAYANAPITSLALSYALTSANQYNNLSISDAVSIIDVAKKAGFTTYWFSTQSKGGINDGSVVTIASRADYAEWLKGYDEILLEKLRKVQPNQKNVVFLHLSGSHYRYKSQFPEALVQKICSNISQPYKEYKSSLSYTDYVLRSFFEYAVSNLNLKAMVYFSDHAEDMKYQHSVSPFRFSMIRIPFWVYCSEELVQLYPEIAQNLQKHQKAIFTNDLIFDFLSGILNIQSNHYFSQFDIANSSYSISLKNALSRRGSVMIRDDPFFKK